MASKSRFSFIYIQLALTGAGLLAMPMTSASAEPETSGWAEFLGVDSKESGSVKDLVERATKQCNKESLKDLEARHGVSYAQIREMIDADAELARAQAALDEAKKELQAAVEKFNLPQDPDALRDAILEAETEENLLKKKTALSIQKELEAKDPSYSSATHGFYVVKENSSPKKYHVREDSWSSGFKTPYKIRDLYYTAHDVEVFYINQVTENSTVHEIREFLKEHKKLKGLADSGLELQDSIIEVLDTRSLQWTNSKGMALPEWIDDFSEIEQRVAVLKKHQFSMQIGESNFERAKTRVIDSRKAFAVDAASGSGLSETKVSSAKKLLGFLARHSDKLMAAAVICPLFTGNEKEKVLSEREISGGTDRAFRSHGF